jgi:hypothetical protein
LELMGVVGALPPLTAKMIKAALHLPSGGLTIW